MVIIFLPKLVRHRVVIRRNSFFFLFPFSYRSHFFLQSFGKKFVVEGGDKSSCTRGIVRTIFSMEILVQLSRRRMSRHMRTLSPLFFFFFFFFPFLFLKVDLSLLAIYLFLLALLRISNYSMDKFVTP